MACTAVQTDMTAQERGRYLYENIPPGLFRAEGIADGSVAWRVSPEPFSLSTQTAAAIEGLGADLVAFYKALNALYARSARGTAPAFSAEYLDRGKPENIVKLARMNRFKADIPQVIRPDLILTDGGFIASELDSVPGGMGFVAAMASTYCAVGHDTLGGVDGIPMRFAEMLVATAGKPQPTVAVVVSDESADYRGELGWLASRINTLATARVIVCAPPDIVFTEEALFFRGADGREEKIDVLYRNFELFDLLNIPKQDLILYAARHNRVKMTPPPKAHLEEKLAFALLHNPQLEGLWKTEMGAEVYDRLKTIFPQTWVIDPRPLPPQAAISGLTASGTPVRDWMQLAALGKSERDYVIKPSGFSELAWGSRGVRVANDLTKEAWIAAIADAVAAYDRTPHILQRFHKGRRVEATWFDRASGELKPMTGRVRLTPYFFVVEGAAKLGGVLATIAPVDKRLIHGMSDAIMAPCAVVEGGY